MNYKLLAFFMLIWMAAAVVTGAVERAADPSEVAGSTADFEALANNVYGGEELEVDRPVASGGNPVSAAISFGNTAVGWVNFLIRAAALDSPIWEGWATPIRYGILVCQVPMLLLLFLEGAKVLSGYIPFT